MLLIEAVISGTTYYLSQDGIALAHWWDNKIMSFSAPKYQMSERHGGYVSLSFGAIEFAPDLFAASWPPPRTITLTAKYTDTTEAAAETFFAGTGYMSNHQLDSVSYDLYGAELDTNLLADGTDYDGNAVVLPRAFGPVSYVQPVRLADRNGNQCYDLGHIQGTVHTHWHVYDDGVDVCSNVTNVTGNTFEYTVTPVGTLTLSGTGEDTTLKDIMEWACGASYLNLSFDHTVDRATSPDVGCWASEQEILVDFLSRISAFHSHLFYIRSGTLYLVDMLIDNGSRIISEWDYFSAPYGYPSPVGKITAKWQKREAGTWSDPTGSSPAAVYVKETEQTHSVTSDYPYGEDMDIEPCSGVLADIVTAIGNMLDILHRPTCEITIPLQAGLPAPGEKISWTDDSFYLPVNLWVRARDITYDFDQEEIIISGEGGIS
jgi:hypothetical protein